jgi:hypothetical protein
VGRSTAFGGAVESAWWRRGRLRRLGRRQEAAAAYRATLDFTDNAAERAFLDTRLAETSGARLPKGVWGRLDGGLT